MAPKKPSAMEELRPQEVGTPSTAHEPHEESEAEDGKANEIQQVDTVDKKRLATQSLARSSASKSNFNNAAAKSQKPTLKCPSSKAGKDDPRMSKRKNGGRVFTEEDEIAILQGMIDLQAQKGVADPSSVQNAVDKFLKGKLSFPFTKIQIYEKVRRSKAKYMKIMEKCEINGDDDIVFSNPHDSEVFELSKKIWGAGSTDNDDAAEDDNTAVVREEVVEGGEEDDEGDFWKKHKFLKQSLDMQISGFLLFPECVKEFMKEKIILSGRSKVKELDKKWERVNQREAELFTKRLSLMNEHTKMVLEAMKKG